jgi:hypothetical protein
MKERLNGFIKTSNLKMQTLSKDLATSQAETNVKFA